MTDDAVYRVPSNDQPDSDPKDTLFIIADDVHRIRARVARLKKKDAREDPRSRTRRLLTNVRILGRNGAALKVAANFSVHRFRRNDGIRVYVGHYRYELRVEGGRLKIAKREAVIDSMELGGLGSVEFYPVKHLAAACSFLVSAGILPVSMAQDFPTKPMRIVAPAAPGGSADILARLIAGKLQERFGQPVVVENRAGAGQMIGADVVAKSPGDGHALLLPTVTYTTSVATAAKLPFDPLNDLAGITMIGDGPFLVVVHPSLPVKSVKELIAFARARPGTLNYASSGTGGITHLITEVFAASANVKLVHVPYKSVAPAVIDVVGGHVPMLIVSVPSVLPQVKAGRLRALAVTSPSDRSSCPSSRRWPSPACRVTRRGSGGACSRRAKRPAPSSAG